MAIFSRNDKGNHPLINVPGLNCDSFKTAALFSRQEEIDRHRCIGHVGRKPFHSHQGIPVECNQREGLPLHRCELFRSDQGQRKVQSAWYLNKSNSSACGPTMTLRTSCTLSIHLPPSTPYLPMPLARSGTSLRSFVLVKRAEFKLHPRSTYLCHLLSDVDF
jgi:mitofusin 2